MIKEDYENRARYTESIFYEIELTAKYCKMLGVQVFEKYHAGLSVDEFVILDTLLSDNVLCQRDIAKIILKDRANTGKLLDTLEKKGLIERNLTVKNNRPVKIVKITQTGVKKVYETMQAIKPHMLAVREKIYNTDFEKIRFLLRDLRKVLNETLEIKI